VDLERVFVFEFFEFWFIYLFALYPIQILFSNGIFIHTFLIWGFGVTIENT